ncbi:glutamate 5-kinase [Propionibacterium cyclohexanicum]|uniref:glutamate 5-kinase n=1 Tax=Propionibacterium cyclohexanicum TaxID=64702 RepID=UPI000A8F08DF
MTTSAEPSIESEEQVRAAIGNARRIVVKIGSSSLSSATKGLDDERLDELVGTLSTAHEGGRDIVLISSGAIAAGLRPLGLSRRPRDLAHQQAAAAVGQGLLMEHYAQGFARRGIRVGQVLLTVDDVTRQSNYRNALRTFGTLLRMGVLPIVNENDTVATHEIRFGDNDRLAALVAQLVRADAMVLLSDVDALYTAHPDDPDAVRIGFVPDVENLHVDTHRLGSAGVGSGGMTTKIQAARIAACAGIPVMMAKAKDAAKALAGIDGGTVFAPIDHRRPRRLLWLAFASEARGRIVLDAGAVRAITGRHASLLAAGITGISGEFAAGDPVELAAGDGSVIARGIVNFSSEELPAMFGRNSAELAAELGVEYEREVIHRDMLVLMNHTGM